MIQIQRSSRSPRYCSSAKTGIASARSAAQDFTDHLNLVLNRTVSDSRLSLVANPAPGDSFFITRVKGDERTPIELHGTRRRLFVQQVIEVVEGSEGKSHCQTLSHVYRLEDDDGEWLIRWEYFRNPPKASYPYPLAHIHVAADFQGDVPVELRRLHIPTRRIPLELVLWHLIVEWEAKPRSDDWRDVLADSIKGWQERRTRHD